MSKKLSLFLIILLMGVVAQLFAGKVSCFENLGFSPDGRYFLFGQYGSDANGEYPFAELYFINAEHNVYYPRGVFKKTYDHPLQLGEEARNALLSLLGDSNVQALRGKLGINHLLTGRQIYQVYEEPGEPKDFSHKELSFIDFEKGDRYRVLLRQSVSESVSKKVESCFFINAQLLSEKGQVLKTITVGHPKYNRDNISNYRIAQVFVVPGQAGLLFVVERENRGVDGDIFYDYMIEIGKLR